MHTVSVRLFLCFPVLLCLCSTPAFAQVTRMVDDDGLATAASCDAAGPALTTIAAGIAAAAAGDTVLVCPGTYVENITFGGKAIAVRSVAGPAATIIDGNAANSVVRFVSGEGPGSVLQGFTLRNGFPKFGPSEGGGVFVNNASPVIRGNDIVGNRACDAAGIGIAFASPLVEENIIRDNTQAGCTGATMGGGVGLRGAGFAIVRRNLIANNTTFGDGGGIGMNGAGAPTIDGNVIGGNVAVEGGGIFSGNVSDANIIGNLIVANRAAKGGGVSWLVVAGTRGPLLVNNTIADNDSPQGSGIFADGFDTSTFLFNNTIVAAPGRTAVFCGNFGDTTGPVFRFNNVFSASSLAYAGVCAAQTGANGNISADPRFVDPADGDYHLQADSPGVNAGDTDAPFLPADDIDGDPRVMGDAGGRLVVDIGADEVAGPGVVQIDAPAAGPIGRRFSVSGWAIDARGLQSGVDTVHVWAHPDGGGAPTFLGVASYGVARPDVAAAFGDSRFTNSGFTLEVTGPLPIGQYVIAAYAHSTLTGRFDIASSVHVTRRSLPILQVDAPAAGATIGRRFQMSGWAIDLAGAEDPPGVDAVHAYAFPAAGGPPLFLGAAHVGAFRPDVGELFGPAFVSSGWSLDATLPEGDYQVAVYARSIVAGTFNAVVVRAVHVAVQSRPRAFIDTPAASSTVGQPFTIAGWALDLDATAGTGIDTVDIVAQPLSPGPEIVVGRATYGPSRPDVAAAFGSTQFTNSGFTIDASGLPPGNYILWVSVHSTVDDTSTRPVGIALTVSGNSLRP